MPRAIWSGAISFGLVNIPVKLHTAVSRKTVSFNQLDARTGARIRYQKVSAADRQEVPREAIVKGYELGDGRYVTVGEEELANLDPGATRTIEIEEFVDLADIDPLLYDASYYVAPDRAALKPYALLVRAMEESGKVGIARFVMRSRQHLCALRAKDGTLVLSAMVYADEVLDPTEIREISALKDAEVSERELGMARQLVESLSGEFRPERFEDTYRNRVLELIQRKAAGEAEVLAAPAAAPRDKVIDLVAALEASVREARQARARHPASRPRASAARRAEGAAGGSESAAGRAGGAAKRAPTPAKSAAKSAAKRAPAPAKSAAKRPRKTA